MLKTDSLIILINSLTKAEKKSFKTYCKPSDYLDLFNLIEKRKDIAADELRKEFVALKPASNFDITVSYLYKRLLNVLLSIREEQDMHYSLHYKIQKARVLFEKSLFEDALQLLRQVKETAQTHENYHALLYASRLELEYLLFLNFPDTSETALLKKHFKITKTLNAIRKINEQSSLYELLKHRTIFKESIRSSKQKESLNDLVVSEMSIVASSSQIDSFEIKKLHQLFQSNYLISVGNYKSAVHSYYELNSLFEQNPHLWATPPSYYLQALSGILDSLRSIHRYKEMPYFIAQLKKLDRPPVNFRTEVLSLIFLYELFPLLDKGNFSESKELTKKYQETVLDKTNLLSLNRQAELYLYLSLIYIGLRDFKQAQKTLLQVVSRGKSFISLPLYRTIRLVNLIIWYEQGHTDLIISETRSIKRELSKTEKAYRVEHTMLNFLNKSKAEFLLGKREKVWNKLAPQLEEMRNDVYEMQLLKFFDFTAWIESKFIKKPLSDVLKSRFE